MRMKKKKRSAQTDDVWDRVNRYGTYEIQQNDGEDSPAIAQGISKKVQKPDR